MDDVRQALEEYAKEWQFANKGEEPFQEAARVFDALRKVLDECDYEERTHRNATYGNFYAAVQVRQLRKAILSALTDGGDR